MLSRDNYALKYGAWIVPTEEIPAAKILVARRVEHLPPEVNRGRSAIFVRVLDENGERMRDGDLRIQWGWQGQRPSEIAALVPLNKPDGEMGHGNLDLYKGQRIWLKLASDKYSSDTVANLHGDHDDEVFNGQIWNGRFHHSYVVTFQLATVPVIVPDGPEVPQAKTVNYQILFTVAGNQVGKAEGTFVV